MNNKKKGEKIKDRDNKKKVYKLTVWEMSLPPLYGWI